MSIPEIKARLESEFNSDFNVLSESSTTLICNCRRWGNWQLPDDVDEDEEDYDNEELTEDSNTKLEAIIEKMNKEFPTYGIDYSFSEKNYIDFNAIEV